MAVSEFGLIQQYFSKSLKNKVINRFGIGDDCALMAIPAGYELVVTTDIMVEGVHFFAGADPQKLAHKLLAVNLSDLAAMGAKPFAVTLALTLPKIDELWLDAFSEGFFSLAAQFSVDLIGGDTTASKVDCLVLTVQAFGLVPTGEAIKRSTAKVGDLIFVTGCLGDAGLGLKVEQGYNCDNTEYVLKQFHTPNPRIKEGLAIRHYANACIDLSDGIASDLKHILTKSQVGACLNWDKIPLSEPVQAYISMTGDWQISLSAGEDYELCFTVSPDNRHLIDINCTQIGIIESQAGLRIQRNNQIEQLKVSGFEHFS